MPSAAAEALRDWAVSSALPLWASIGFDRTANRFEERLTFDGRPIIDVPVRLMVQARQIFSYGVAAKRGWYPEARGLVERAYASMVRDYHGPDGRDGWVFSIWRDGAVADGKRDLYGHAFALLAIASYVDVTGKRDALALADRTLTFLDTNMRIEVGGFADALPRPDAIRRQNPHMHLFEGFLALWLASSERRYLERAAEMFDLFQKYFFQPHQGVLGEYYDQSLKHADGEIGEIVEPGHHYEWIWLLRRFEAASGRDVTGYVDALYRHADRFGFASSGLIFDELLADGQVRTASHRAWPMTEAIKANVVEAACGRAGAADRAARMVSTLLGRFLRTHPSGGWIDRLDEQGRAATDFVPASTLYHIICALDVLSEAAGDGGGKK